MAIYNNPAIGQSMENIASLFAPPSASDLAGYSAAALNRQKKDQLAQLFGAGANPSEQAALVGIQDYGATPGGFTFKVNQDNATSRANNLTDNQTKLALPRFSPLDPGQVLPAVDGALAKQFGMPDLAPVNGPVKPLSEEQVKGNLLQDVWGQGLVTPQDVATQYKSGTNVEEVLGPNGPQFVTRDQAPGMAPAPKTPLVSMGGESAYDKVLGESRGKVDAQIETEAANSQASLNTITVMRGLMKDPNFYSGPAADQIYAAKALGASLGIILPDAAAPVEAFSALSNQLIIDAAGGSLGNQISNGDVKFLQNSKPNLNYTEAGNTLLLDITEKLVNRKIEVAQWAEEYKAAHGGRLDSGWAAFQKQKAEANPLFPNVGTPAPIQPGHVEDGYVFNGGDPADPASWSPAGGQ